MIMFNSFMKEHVEKDYTELATMLGISKDKMETFREMIDDLQVHNANPSNQYVPKLPEKKKISAHSLNTSRACPIVQVVKT